MKSPRRSRSRRSKPKAQAGKALRRSPRLLAKLRGGMEEEAEEENIALDALGFAMDVGAIAPAVMGAAALTKKTESLGFIKRAMTSPQSPNGGGNLLHYAAASVNVPMLQMAAALQASDHIEFGLKDDAGKTPLELLLEAARGVDSMQWAQALELLSAAPGSNPERKVLAMHAMFAAATTQNFNAAAMQRVQAALARLPKDWATLPSGHPFQDMWYLHEGMAAQHYRQFHADLQRSDPQREALRWTAFALVEWLQSGDQTAVAAVARAHKAQFSAEAAYLLLITQTSAPASPLWELLLDRIPGAATSTTYSGPPLLLKDQLALGALRRNHINLVWKMASSGLQASANTLVMAAEKGQAALCKFLIERCGAPANERNARGMYAIFAAANTLTLRGLLRAGANPNVRGSGMGVSDTLLIDIANQEEVRLLLEFNAVGTDMALWRAVEGGWADVVRKLLQQGVNATTRGLLHVAKTVEVAKLLLENGADVTALYNDRTPLQAARNAGIARLYRQHGAQW